MISHRPPQDMLVDYATGALAQPVAVAVATHAELCAESRAEIAEMEAVGGAMLASLTPVAVSQDSLDRVLALVGADDADLPVAASAVDYPEDDTADGASLPAAIRSVLNGDTESITWKRKGPSVESAVLDSQAEAYEVRLLRIKAGKAVPQHTHEGLEVTLCLAGGYTDRDDHYARGDFQVADPSLDHRPVADADEDCIVLAVVEKDIRLTSPLGRLINPFVRL